MTESFTHDPAVDFSETALQDLMKELVAAEFEPYLTAVGGSGMGILSPYPEHRASQVTPPATPALDGPQPAEPELQKTFETQTVLDLSKWAEGLGRWLYV